MKCKKAKKLFSRFIDNELDELLTNDLKVHLKFCVKCQKDLEKIKNIDGHLKHTSVPELSEFFINDLLLKVNLEEQDKKQKKMVFGVIGFFANFCHEFFELIDSKNDIKANTFDEFNDFPPISIGSAYLNLILKTV